MSDVYSELKAYGADVMMLSDEEAGRLLKALYAYCVCGTVHQIGGQAERLLMDEIARMDESRARAVDISAKRSAAGKMGAEARLKSAKKRKDYAPKPRKPVAVPEEPAEPEVIVARFPLIDGTDYLITQSYFDKMQSLFSELDMKEEFENMTSWCINNPSHRKQRKFATRFINTWLQKSRNAKKNGQTGMFRDRPYAPARKKSDMEIVMESIQQDIANGVVYEHL